MKKNTVTIIITVVLAIIAVFLYLDNKKGTIPKERTDFAVNDTSAITKIFLANKANNRVTLDRVNQGSWTVNSQYKARKDLINILLKTMKTLRVNSPVSKAAHNNVVKRLASGAIKVEIYLNGNDQPDKVYYVGGATQNQQGTYMLLENSSTPFIMEIPMFSGYLSTRYNTDVKEWRDKTIFNYKFKDIASVTVEYPLYQDSSFIILNTGNWTYTLKSLYSDEPIPGYDTTALKIFLTNFKNIQFSGFAKRMDNTFRDSILSSKPLQVITLSDRSGKNTKVTCYLKPLPEVTTDMAGTQVAYDIDLMYATIDDNDEFVIVQYYVFAKLLVSINGFLKKRV